MRIRNINKVCYFTFVLFLLFKKKCKGIFQHIDKRHSNKLNVKYDSLGLDIGPLLLRVKEEVFLKNVFEFQRYLIINHNKKQIEQQQKQQNFLLNRSNLN